MYNFIFWNVAQNDLRANVNFLVSANAADVIILIENEVSAIDTLSELKASVSNEFQQPKAISTRFQLFSRRMELNLSEVYCGFRTSLRRLEINGKTLLLGLVHVVDKYSWDDAQQLLEVQMLAEEIRQQEKHLKNDCTVLVGDFNMNPFAPAMNVAPGLNSMMTEKCVEKGSRTIQLRNYPFFYNPMWHLFGDRSLGPPGTFYHSSSSRGFYGWNMLDQVLLRPSAICHFENVTILDSAGGTPLCDARQRPSKKISDHLPILFTLK